MTYTFLLACAAVFLTLSAAAQDLPKTMRAVERFEQGDIAAARDAVLEALQDKQERQHPYTWFVKGFLFKEIFKEVEKANPYSENREIAVQAIRKSIELDTADEYLDNNRKALKYLALSYYNDAVRYTRGLTRQNFNEPQAAFDRYKELYAIAEPGYDFNGQTLEFNKNMARGCRLLYEQGGEGAVLYFDKMVDYYKKALAINPDDFQANYNLSVNYYNQGVDRIKRIDHTTEIFELMAIQDECVSLFRKALPYMLKAHEIKPDHQSTLKGLMAIYKSLSEDDRATAYREELESLIKNNSSRD